MHLVQPLLVDFRVMLVVTLHSSEKLFYLTRLGSDETGPQLPDNRLAEEFYSLLVTCVLKEVHESGPQVFVVGPYKDFKLRY